MNDAFDRALRDAVSAGRASHTLRERWITDALATTSPTRSPRIAMIAAGVAAALILGALVFAPNEERAARTDRVAAPDVDAERRHNERALEAASKAERFARAAPGAAVCVAGGEVFVGDGFDAVLSTARERHPHARHRFVFSLDEKRRVPGDVILDRAPFRVLSIGAWFLQHVGARAVREGEEWRVTRGDREVVTEKGRLEFDLATETDGTFGERRTILGMPIVADSMAPLVFNEKFGMPRFETPGRMIVEDAGGNWRAFRRYTVRVRHEGLGIDRWVDAIGRGSREAIAPGNWIAVRFGGYVFHGLRRPASELAREPGRPLVVLRFRAGSAKRLDTLFGTSGDALDDCRHYAIPDQSTNRLDRYDREGKVVGTLDLDTATPADVAAFLGR